MTAVKKDEADAVEAVVSLPFVAARQRRRVGVRVRVSLWQYRLFRTSDGGQWAHICHCRYLTHGQVTEASVRAGYWPEHTHQLHFTPLLFSDTVVEGEWNSFFIFNWSEFSGVWVDFEAVHDASLHFCNSLMNRHKCPFSSNEPAFITSSSLGGFYFNHVTHYRGWIWLPGMKPTWTKLNCHFNTSRSDDCFSFMKEKNTFSSSSEVIGGAVCHHLKERLWTPTWRPRAHVSVVGK